MTFFAHFEIDIVSALSTQLVATLDLLSVAALDEVNIAALREGQGVYALFHIGTLVYVGQTKSLPKRLREHLKKISGRRRIIIGEMSFKCLYVHKNWTALAPEESLITTYQALKSGVCAWNGNGFGPHDPGRNRELTDKPPDGFDKTYPIIDDWPCTWVDAREWNVKELLISLKENLPYLLRYKIETHYRTGHPDYNNAVVNVPSLGMAARDLLALIARGVPKWVATAFCSHFIFYPDEQTYPHGTKLV